MCAEMAADLEPCRAMMWYAAHALDAIPDEARLTACHTKASLKMFDLIFAMTGPDNGATGHPALNMYLTTFRANDFAKGAAIAIVLFIVATTFIIPYLINNYRQKGKR